MNHGNGNVHWWFFHWKLHLSIHAGDFMGFPMSIFDWRSNSATFRHGTIVMTVRHGHVAMVGCLHKLSSVICSWVTFGFDPYQWFLPKNYLHGWFHVYIPAVPYHCWCHDSTWVWLNLNLGSRWNKRVEFGAIPMLHETFFIFPYIGNNHPNWRTHIFHRGGPTTNQMMLPSGICSFIVCCALEPIQLDGQTNCDVPKQSLTLPQGIDGSLRLLSFPSSFPLVGKLEKSVCPWWFSKTPN